METFGELLTIYMARTGIGDAELARRIPVSRLTLVRWKEGVTARPRYREDVVRCAELLRLTDEETDALLLSAGYSPETLPAGEEAPPLVDAPEAPASTEEAEAPGTAPSAPEPKLSTDTPAGHPGFPAGVPQAAPALRRTRRWRVTLAGAAVLVLLFVAAAGGVAWNSRDTTVYPAAADGESLIVLAPFVNYTAGGQGFNVAGRLKAGIDREVREAGLAAVRTVEWPRDIADEAAANAAIERSGAALAIWGEYDSGRVIARVTVPGSDSAPRAQQVVDIASSPTELPATINIGLVSEVRSVALLTLGQLFLERQEYDQAKTVLIRAMDPPPAEAGALTKLRFLLGRAYLGGDWADFDEAIWLFTQVLSEEPRSVESLNSRALAYLDRGRPGDPDLAVADLTRAASIKPGRAATDLNLAVAYAERDGPGDVDRALASLENALEAEPGYTGALVNRAGIFIARGGEGDLDRAFEDLERALESEPGLAEAHINRANAYLSRRDAGDLDLASAELTRAIELSPDSAAAHFNRGLVNSELGNWNQSLDDLGRAQQLKPREPVYNRILCLQWAVLGDPAHALRFCNLAAEGDPEGLSRDSRGIVNALVGNRQEAVADFEVFLSWVDDSSQPGCSSEYAATRSAWIASLNDGRNPIEGATLLQQRPSPILPGEPPC